MAKVVDFPISDIENIKAYNSVSCFKNFFEYNRIKVDIWCERKKKVLDDFFGCEESKPIKKIINNVVLKDATYALLDRSKLHKINKNIVPVAKMPEELKTNMNQTNRAILLNIFSNNELFRKALLNMKFTANRYGTDYFNQEWTILGVESKQAIDLIFLAHELGHVMYNQGGKYINTDFESIIKSEATAFLFEHVIARSILPPPLFTIWQDYNNKTVLLNTQLLLLELSMTMDYESLKENIDLALFNREHLLLVEPFWTSHGYFLIYHLANILKEYILNKSH